ncbi:MAG: transposase [Egibacteraceae bacterium]
MAKLATYRSYKTPRKHADPEAARAFKGARWALGEKPRRPDLPAGREAVRDQTDRRRDLARLQAQREALRAIFDRDLEEGQVTKLSDRWLSWAQRSRIEEFVKLGRTIRAHRDGILAAIRLGCVQRPGRRVEQ